MDPGAYKGTLPPGHPILQPRSGSLRVPPRRPTWTGLVGPCLLFCIRSHVKVHNTHETHVQDTGSQEHTLFHTPTPACYGICGQTSNEEKMMLQTPCAPCLGRPYPPASSPVLRVRLLGRRLSPALGRVALRRPVSAAACHAHDVGPVLEGLGKVADAADDVDVPLHG
jgi:hypothetical protein